MHTDQAMITMTSSWNNCLFFISIHINLSIQYNKTFLGISRQLFIVHRQNLLTEKRSSNTDPQPNRIVYLYCLKPYSNFSFLWSYYCLHGLLNRWENYLCWMCRRRYRNVGLYSRQIAGHSLHMTLWSDMVMFFFTFPQVFLKEPIRSFLTCLVLSELCSSGVWHY